MLDTNETPGQFRMPPPTITRATMLVLSPDFPVALSPQLRWALSLLLRRVEARDGEKEFWVKRCNFAEMVGRCSKTITNWLNDLEDAGLLEREQSKTGWGEFRCLSARLTKRAVHLLALDVPIATRKVSSHAIDTREIQSKRDSGQRQNLIEKTQSTKPLPIDIQPIENLGLSRSMIFSLMGICKKHSVRLGDVIEVCLDQIKKATNPYAYIRGIVASGRDFAACVHRKRASQAKEVEKVQACSSIEAGWALVEGVTFEAAGKRLKAASRGPIEVYDLKGNYLYLLAGEPLLNLVKKIGRGDITIHPA